MKLIICMFIMLISAKECDKNKEQLATQNNSEAIAAVEQSEKKVQNDMKITYQAVSRGFFLTIVLEGDSISYSSDRDLKSLTAHDIPEKEKDALLDLMSAMDENDEINKELTKKEDALIQSLEELTSTTLKLENLKADLDNLISR